MQGEGLLWLPLGAAFLYTISTLFLKRALEAGTGPMRATFVTNILFALVFLPGLWFAEAPISTELMITSLVASLLFFGGQVLTVLAVEKGDVSVATPLMGTKVIFVALFLSLMLGEPPSFAVWFGAFLCAGAVFLLRGETVTERRRLLPAILLGLASAMVFGAADVFVQRGGGEFGFTPFVPIMFGLIPLYSLGLIPFFKRPLRAISREAWKWLLISGFIVAVQAQMMALAISLYGNATLVNILYSTRGIWSVALVGMAGAWFAIREQKTPRAALLRRLIGSLLLVLAVVIALYGRESSSAGDIGPIEAHESAADLSQ